jgi:hypothetical protein
MGTTRADAFSLSQRFCGSTRPAPKGQENLAQGLPWVRQNKRFALKGLGKRLRSSSKVPSRFWPHMVAPSGLIRAGELPRVNPGLCFLAPSGRLKYENS